MIARGGASAPAPASALREARWVCSTASSSGSTAWSTVPSRAPSRPRCSRSYRWRSPARWTTGPPWSAAAAPWCPTSSSSTCSPHDHDRLSVYAGTLTEELGTTAREHAEEQRYTFLGGTEITLARDDSLETGLFRVHSEAKAGVASAPNPARMPSIPSSRPDAGHPRLVGDDVDHPLSRAVTRIGRGSDVDIRVDDPGVSRHHAEILLGREVVLRDLGSTNGTYVDGVQVGEVVLRDGATVQLGSVRLTFRAG